MRRFPTLPRLAAAPPRAVEEAIRVGGLAGAKAKAILSALGRLNEERGGYTLDFLADMPLAEARAHLTSFPGVGVKTANVILLFSFRREAFPVDTHVLRVAKRLGLVPQNATLARAALLVEPHVPAGEHAPLHLNMIRLGREICRPRNPRHDECPLLPVCPEGKRSVKPPMSMDGQVPRRGQDGRVPRRSGRPGAAKPGRRERPPGTPRP